MTPEQIAAETVSVVPHPTGTAVAWGKVRMGPDGQPQYAEHPFFVLQENAPPERLAQMERELRKIVQIAIERGIADQEWVKEKDGFGRTTERCPTCGEGHG